MQRHAACLAIPDVFEDVVDKLFYLLIGRDLLLNLLQGVDYRGVMSASELLAYADH